METLQLKLSVTNMLANAGIDSKVTEITPIYGGGNNKVVSVSTEAGKYLAKIDKKWLGENVKLSFSFTSIMPESIHTYQVYFPCSVLLF